MGILYLTENSNRHLAVSITKQAQYPQTNKTAHEKKASY